MSATTQPLIAGGLALVLSFMLVGMMRRFALKLSILDHPNDRSSHAIPTPRGGGVGAIAAMILVLVATGGSRISDWQALLALLSVLPTAAAGWMDDRRSLTVRTRLAAHLTSALLLLPLAHQATPVTGTFWIVVAAAWVFATISAINILNFMDGIDGIIGLQAAVLGLHYALLSVPSVDGSLFGLVLCGAAVGFLLWNWAPARVFLGDVGSGALGVIGIVGGLIVLREGRYSFLATFLPLVPICLDSALTIVRRARRGEKLTLAHRSHLYQRLANDGWGHAVVALGYGVAAAVGSAIANFFTTARLPVAAIVYVAALLAVGYLAELQVKLPRSA